MSKRPHYTISKPMNLRSKKSSIFMLIKFFELLVLKIVLWTFTFQIGREENIKYFHNYQVNLLNHVSHLNHPIIEKASPYQISLFTRATPFTCSLLSIRIVAPRKERQMCIVFCDFKRQKTAEYAKRLADQVEESTKKKN